VVVIKLDVTLTLDHLNVSVDQRGKRRIEDFVETFKDNSASLEQCILQFLCITITLHLDLDEFVVEVLFEELDRVALRVDKHRPFLVLSLFKYDHVLN
jgi:hypothetical protein